MKGVNIVCVLCATVAVMLAPAQARADGYANPWIGADGVDRNDNGRIAFGITTGYMGAGVFGFEADLGYSPNFLGSDGQFDHSHALTLMGNAILGIPIGGSHGAGIRPFVTGGIGLLRTHSEIQGPAAELSQTTNNPAYQAGVGMMGFFGEHVGLRGDLRYFRTLDDVHFGSLFDFNPGRLHFWRVSGGLTFR